MGFDRQHQISAESIALFETLDDPRGLALAKWRLAHVIMQEPPSEAAEFERARALLHESDRELRALGDRWTLLYPEAGFGRLAVAQRNFAQAYVHFERALAYAREGGSPWLVDVVLHSLLRVAKATGDAERKRVYALEIYDHSRHFIAARSAYAILTLAVVEFELCQWVRAVDLFREMLVYARRHQMKKPLIDALWEIGTLILTMMEAPDLPADSVHDVARAFFGGVRPYPTHETDLRIFATTLLGAVAVMLDPEMDGPTLLLNEWMLFADLAQRLLDADSFRLALEGGFVMTAEQAVAYALNERP
jgi:hypothetical protein